MSYKEKKFLDKKETRDISDQYSRGEIDGLLYGSSMERGDPFQDYFQGMYMLKGNSYFHVFQQQHANWLQLRCHSL